jgi:hypothetical protein
LTTVESEKSNTRYTVLYNFFCKNVEYGLEYGYQVKKVPHQTVSGATSLVCVTSGNIFLS